MGIVYNMKNDTFTENTITSLTRFNHKSALPEATEDILNRYRNNYPIYVDQRKTTLPTKKLTTYNADTLFNKNTPIAPPSKRKGSDKNVVSDITNGSNGSDKEIKKLKLELEKSKQNSDNLSNQLKLQVQKTSNLQSDIANQLKLQKTSNLQSDNNKTLADRLLQLEKEKIIAEQKASHAFEMTTVLQAHANANQSQMEFWLQREDEKAAANRQDNNVRWEQFLDYAKFSKQ
jgi:hypothetical protein